MRVAMNVRALTAIAAVVIAGGTACGNDDDAAGAATADETTTTTAVEQTTTTTAVEQTTTTTERGVEVTFDVVQEIRFGSGLCDEKATPKACIAPYTGTSTYTGDVTGTGVLAGGGTAVEQAAGGAHEDVITATIQGCGEGSFVMAWSDHGTLGGAFAGTWIVVEGLGTGDLAGMTGGGTFAARDQPSFTGSLTGRLDCD